MESFWIRLLAVEFGEVRWSVPGTDTGTAHRSLEPGYSTQYPTQYVSSTTE